MASSWERLGSTTLGSAGDQIDVTIAARKHLIIKCIVKSDGLAKARIRFNDDTGSNYTYRAYVDGGSTEAGGAANVLIIDNHNIASNETFYCDMNVINIAGKEKLCTIHYVNNDEDGAGNAPKRALIAGKWANTSAQIIKVSLINPESGSYRSGSTVTVWGADDQASTAKDKSSITNVPVGTRYEEVDTRKIFRRKSGASTTATQETASETTSIDSGSKGAGQYIRTTSSAFYGKILTDVQFKLHSTTAQAGAKVYARHYNSSGVLIHTYWEKLASALPSSSTWTTETTLAGDTAYANGDYFVCEYMETDGTSATGAVITYRKHNDSGTKYDGANSNFINTYFGSSSYLDTGSRDAWFKITIKTPNTWVEKGTA